MSDPIDNYNDQPQTPPPGDSAPQAPGKATCQVVLVKHGQQYVFRYEPGSEGKMLQGLVELVRDPDCELDWFDAAVLSYQMGQQMSQEMGRLLKSAIA
jgi:hypothetical protein